MHTITIQIIDKKVLPLLKDLEHLNLIRLHENIPSLNETNPSQEIPKAPLNDIENQLNELRNEWE